MKRIVIEFCINLFGVMFRLSRFRIRFEFRVLEMVFGRLLQENRLKTNEQMCWPQKNFRHFFLYRSFVAVTSIRCIALHAHEKKNNRMCNTNLSVTCIYCIFLFHPNERKKNEKKYIHQQQQTQKSDCFRFTNLFQFRWSNEDREK